MRVCPKTYHSACPGVAGGAVLDMSGEHSQSSWDVPPQHRGDLVEQMTTDYLHGRSGEAAVGDSEPSESLTCSWSPPCWHFMEQMVPSGFTPHPSPWVVVSVDRIRETCAGDMAGNTLTIAVTAGATSGCLLLHCPYQSNCFQGWMKPWGAGNSVEKGDDGIEQGISISNTEERDLRGIFAERELFQRSPHSC